MNSIKVFEGQTIYDIVIQEYGCFEAIFLLLEDNSSLNIDSELTAGQSLNIRSEVPEITADNINVIQYFKTKNIKPNSGYKPEAIEGEFESDDFLDSDYLV